MKKHPISKKGEKRTPDPIKRLTREDVSAQYEALCEIKPYSDKSLFLHFPFVEAVLNLASSKYPAHIRCQAIKVLGYASDAYVAEYVSPFLTDQDVSIVCQAISSLTALEADRCAPDILEIMATTNRAKVRNACLSFFASTAVHDEPTVLSIVELMKHLLDQHPEAGSQTQIVEVFGKQWNGINDAALEALLPFLEPDKARFREAALASIAKEIGESYVGSPSLRKKLRDAIRRSLTEGSDVELAKAWTSALQWDRIERNEIWNAVKSADVDAVDALLSDLDNYYVDRVLDAPEDVDALEALLDKFPVLREKISDILAETHNARALDVLARGEFLPSGWQAVDVLCGLAKEEKWDSKRRKLLEAALSAEMPYGADFRDAFGLIAQYRSGIITLQQVVERFPQLKSSFCSHDRFKNDLIRILEKLTLSASKSLARRISTLKAKIGTGA